ncbi:hypothetical protein F4825DRAFT_179234 [Nemania diffusa]|nr:hypothetical protein F4825DRAFT_179234 [Nemania diffusa]
MTLAHALSAASGSAKADRCLDKALEISRASVDCLKRGLRRSGKMPSSNETKRQRHGARRGHADAVLPPSRETRGGVFSFSGWFNPPEAFRQQKIVQMKELGRMRGQWKAREVGGGGRANHVWCGFIHMIESGMKYSTVALSDHVRKYTARGGMMSISDLQRYPWRRNIFSNRTSSKILEASGGGDGCACCY